MFGRWSVLQRTVSNVLHMSKLETGLLWEIMGSWSNFWGDPSAANELEKGSRPFLHSLYQPGTTYIFVLFVFFLFLLFLPFCLLHTILVCLPLQRRGLSGFSCLYRRDGAFVQWWFVCKAEQALLGCFVSFVLGRDFWVRSTPLRKHFGVINSGGGDYMT